MRVMDIAQILSHSSFIEKSQQAHQRMNEEAQKMFFLNIQNEIIRKDKKIPKTPQKEQVKLEHNQQGQKQKGKRQRQQNSSNKHQTSVDIKV